MSGSANWFPGLDTSSGSRVSFDSTSKQSLIGRFFRSRILTNVLLCLVAIAMIGIFICTALAVAYLYKHVDIVAISDAFVEVKSLAAKSNHGYEKVKGSIPFNVSVVLEKAWPKSDREGEKFVDHLKAGLYGAASVLTEMDTLEFIHKVTPLLEKLSEASATEAAKDGSLGFGRVFKFLGKAVDDRESQLNLDLWHNIANKLLLLVSNNQTIPTVESLERTIHNVVSSGTVERGVDSMVTIAQHMASVEFDGKEVGKSVTSSAHAFSHIMEDYNNANATVHLLHSLNVISEFMNNLAGSGVNIGFGQTVTMKKV